MLQCVNTVPYVDNSRNLSTSRSAPFLSTRITLSTEGDVDKIGTVDFFQNLSTEWEETNSLDVDNSYPQETIPI